VITAPSKSHHASTMALGARLLVQSTSPVGKSGLHGSDLAKIPIEGICDKFVRRDGQGKDVVDSRSYLGMRRLLVESPSRLKRRIRERPSGLGKDGEVGGSSSDGWKP
jgi:hypothetical protein